MSSYVCGVVTDFNRQILLKNLQSIGRARLFSYPITPGAPITATELETMLRRDISDDLYNILTAGSGLNFQPFCSVEIHQFDVMQFEIFVYRRFSDLSPFIAAVSDDSFILTDVDGGLDRVDPVTRAFAPLVTHPRVRNPNTRFIFDMPPGVTISFDQDCVVIEQTS